MSINILIYTYILLSVIFIEHGPNVSYGSNVRHCPNIRHGPNVSNGSNIRHCPNIRHGPNVSNGSI